MHLSGSERFPVTNYSITITKPSTDVGPTSLDIVDEFMKKKKRDSFEAISQHTSKYRYPYLATGAGVPTATGAGVENPSEDDDSTIDPTISVSRF
jgi:hypothetical protein